MTVDKECAWVVDERVNADFALGLWNDRWVMSDEAVSCSYCLATQLPSDAHTPLAHYDGCQLAASSTHCAIWRRSWGPHKRVCMSVVFSPNGVCLPNLILVKLANHLGA